ncbi:MAG: HAD hydrolase-like protein [Candidatus Lokiarchaeota archaeon]|nr:HAD hydrolase-like protein [Candidatus Lokiarchaeota archaeon]
MTVAIFFDDGGVLNDNSVRGEQWKKLVGEYYYSRFGGVPEIWGEANHKIITSYLNIFWSDLRERFRDYQTFYTDFKKNMVLGMFREVGEDLPKNINLIEVFNSVTQYVIPKVRSAIPGVIESIKKLSSSGYSLYTAAGAVSTEMKMYLEGMGIIQYFKGFYGPDLINTWKSGKDFYRAIFKDLSINPKNAIIIDDQPRFLEVALQTGANVIQSCITGEFEPQYPFYVKKMKDLPQLITDLLDFHNL